MRQMSQLKEEMVKNQEWLALMYEELKVRDEKISHLVVEMKAERRNRG